MSHGLVEVVPTSDNKLLIAEGAPSPLLLRGTVLNKLVEAAQSLPDDFSLIIHEAHRSQSRQFGYWNHRMISVARSYPHMTDQEVIEEARRWTADPVDRPSGHQAGAAVDVTIISNGGREIDMGCDILDVNERTPTQCAAGMLSDAQIENREWLKSTMERKGLINYNEECFNDRLWAEMIMHGSDTGTVGAEHYEHTIHNLDGL